MIKLMIVDDEPLAQLGIESLLDWKSYDIVICGKAMNGLEAFHFIKEYSPDLVITDIKMPVMDGMELIHKCRNELGRLPLFIVLTCYEEFRLVKEALQCQVIDYLIKVELDSAMLTQSVTKALNILQEIKDTEINNVRKSKPLLLSFSDKFYIRLLYNLFESAEQFYLQANDLSISFSSQYYAAAHCEIRQSTPKADTNDTIVTLYHNTYQMIGDILNKQTDCHLVSLDSKHFAIIFCMHDSTVDTLNQISQLLSKTSQMIHLYFNTEIYASLGKPCSDLLQIAESYQEARQLFCRITKENPILIDTSSYLDSMRNVFNLSLLKRNITEAFEELNTDTLYSTMSDLIDLFSMYPQFYTQAFDAACNTLYLALSLIPEGSETISKIFCESPDSYRCLYNCRTTSQVTDYMCKLRDGLCSCLCASKKTMRHHVVTSVKKYINHHVCERLTLNQIAAIFGISPNYLSMLFGKYSDVGFTDYINQCKINKAKELMSSSNLKIYEIAQQLGFENAFYFSRVFKKFEGCAPKDYYHQS